MCAYAFLLRQSTRNIAVTWYCEMANGHTAFVRPRRRCQEMWIIGGTCWEKNYKNNTCPFNFQTKSKYVEHGIEWERDSSIAIWSYNELTVCDIWIVALEWRNLNQARHHIRNLARSLFAPNVHCLPVSSNSWKCESLSKRLVFLQWILPVIATQCFSEVMVVLQLADWTMMDNAAFQLWMREQSTLRFLQAIPIQCSSGVMVLLSLVDTMNLDNATFHLWMKACHTPRFQPGVVIRCFSEVMARR